ncbi:hypothetical protein Q8B01_003679 [Salmonella enterica]|nr:hypothetical protein [Salmonella enterica]EDW1395979.1 hypothetical protein [Salmonella enterica subsp. enterica serovar Oranienburg]ECO7667260.1 hypothetical protein [Salmonella enterica]ECQ3859175.1 hypothetical protein [Salmonella enterica]ECY0024491.1 hypothetical protein [Salmonella enterica]
MNSTLSLKERKATFAELKAEYLFIAIPFLLLISIKIYISTWQEIITSPDWSLASCLIFGQITSKVSKAVACSNTKTSEHFLGWYTAKCFLLVVISIAAYFGMLAKPTMSLGYIQIIIFITASYFHFKDGFTTKLLQKNECKR